MLPYILLLLNTWYKCDGYKLDCCLLAIKDFYILPFELN